MDLLDVIGCLRVRVVPAERAHRDYGVSVEGEKLAELGSHIYWHPFPFGLWRSSAPPFAANFHLLDRTGNWARTFPAATRFPFCSKSRSASAAAAFDSSSCPVSWQICARSSRAPACVLRKSIASLSVTASRASSSASSSRP